MLCAVDDLEVIGGSAAEPTTRRPGPSPAPTVAAVSSELNLIGRRVDEALDLVDSYLDRALLSADGDVRIVHGHGSGRLRKAIREHLRDHPAAAAIRPGRKDEGGDGATVVSLRE
jgi:DNA mismatch repair protein MutS2